MIAVHGKSDRAYAREMTQAVIDSLSADNPAALTEVMALGFALKRALRA